MNSPRHAGSPTHTGSPAPLHGLILAGGASTRMQRDKAALPYQGKTQLDRAFELAQRHVAQVFVSVRSSQITEPTRAHRPLIVDSVDGGGPMVGIRSALAAYPEAAWLVLACDLPFLTDAAIEQLIAERDPDVLATAYLSAHDGLPEPLCAIWEPAAAAAIAAYSENGGICPRKFLRTHPVKLIEPRDRRALDNINTPEEYALAQNTLAQGVPAHGASGQATSTTQAPNPTYATGPAQHPVAGPVPLTIQYFALLREQAGRSEETVQTSAATPADLFDELNARYGFTLSREQLKVAVNTEFAEWSHRLRAGDAVVFIPPVAGG
jgi:molybdenum cofactor guanylyltransferase